MDEQRESIRINLRDPLLARSDLAGSSITAELIDISETGAKLRFQQTDVRPTIEKGHRADWTISLPSGKQTRFKAEARWFHRLPEGYILGVKLLEAMNETLLGELQQSNRLA